MQIQHGTPYPLGASRNGSVLNLAVFSANAEALEVVFFRDPSDRRPIAEAALPARTDQIWHGAFDGLPADVCYGLRARGPYDPARGLRFNDRKLLLDPWARAVEGAGPHDDRLWGFRRDHADADLVRDDRDSVECAPLARFTDEPFDWQGVQRPQTAWRDTVIYEAHVRGLTRLHPDLPPELRGTYPGLCAPPIVERLRRLGVSAVELLPIHHAWTEPHLYQRGLPNYWGYNTLSFFAPDPRYASAVGDPRAAIREFKTMVRELHRAGIEVILDVVYNHSCEGDETGPTLSLRGLDNRSYYLLDEARPRYYQNHTGCGNALNLNSPRVLQLVLDSLRYWTLEMGVDGFRFDLAATLLRGPGGRGESAFAHAVLQDPLLAQTKLIAEAWDIGPDGYRVGAFAAPFGEWNDRYRDATRRFWRGDAGALPDFATRITGSSDIFPPGRRDVRSSINFSACHDGFTLYDLCSYEQKRNEANGEDNRDGSNHNLSWNCGVEGPTDDSAILARRRKQVRNFLTTLFVSQGTPMLLAGDELLNSQNGNNNAYCQDNELAWIDWSPTPEKTSLVAFVARLAQLRRDHAGLRRLEFFHGREIDDAGARDIHWHHPRGRELNDDDWRHPRLLVFGALIHMDPRDPAGDALLLLFNGLERNARFRLPDFTSHPRYELLLDTNSETGEPAKPFSAPAKSIYQIAAKSVAVFRAD